jgi:hypothetical protein
MPDSFRHPRLPERIRRCVCGIMDPGPRRGDDHPMTHRARLANLANVSRDVPRPHSPPAGGASAALASSTTAS